MKKFISSFIFFGLSASLAHADFACQNLMDNYDALRLTKSSITSNSGSDSQQIDPAVKQIYDLFDKGLNECISGDVGQGMTDIQSATDLLSSLN